MCFADGFLELFFECVYICFVSGDPGVIVVVLRLVVHFVLASLRIGAVFFPLSSARVCVRCYH